MRKRYPRIRLISAVLVLFAVQLVPAPLQPPTPGAVVAAAEMPHLLSPAGAVAAGPETQPPAPGAGTDPQLPAFMQGRVDKAAYLRARAEAIGRLRGIEPGQSSDPTARTRALGQLAAQTARGVSRPAPGAPSSAAISPTSWTFIGPAPIPNGQTDGVVTPVSGRVTAIAVHPTNPNTVYVGTAQGGLYRTLNGGASWTALLDTATPGATGGSLAIGAVAIAPSQPSTVFVGTGEGNLSTDSFFGVGMYRITNADTAPAVAGPFAARVAGTATPADNGNAFAGAAIAGIAVDPANASRVFFATIQGNSGLSGGDGPAPLPTTGLYFTDTALAPIPTFSLVAGGLPAGPGFTTAGTDVRFEPGSSTNLLVSMESGTVAADSGIWRTTNAGTAAVSGNVAPIFIRTLATTVTCGNPPSAFCNSKLAINKVGATVTVIAATEENLGNGAGTIHKSVDGGATWDAAVPFPLNNAFCNAQCSFDIGVALDPANASLVHLGGNAPPPATASMYLRSIDGGASFTHPPNTGLHADTHAIMPAPSNGNIVYHGNDGGINKSLDGGLTWLSLNNQTFSATQFQSLATHPVDRQFAIGGTQDNGTNFLQPSAAWTRVDFGDGGFARIDQNATSTSNLTMYHTYFNEANAGANSVVGYARVTSVANASDDNWTFLGCSGAPANGINCNDSAVLFYAPLELGPGSPNTVYFGTDRLYRSANSGTSHVVVSQAPLVNGVPISAIGIARQTDAVRIVGLANGRVFATTTGASVLADVTGAIPARYVARAVIDPNNVNTAYVTLDGYGLPTGQHVWKTINLNGAPPVWAPAGGSGLNAIPDVPVNAFVVDPLNSQNLYAGTDIGVYRSTDGGASWTPFSTGLPAVAVFDMAFQGKGQVYPFPTGQVLRIATHGRGSYEITGQQAPTPTPTPTLTPTRTATPTITPTPAPRPNVGVQVAPGGGTLHTTITARDAGCAGGNNQLQSVRVTRLTNATVDVATSPVTSVSTAPQTVPLPSLPASIALTVNRVTPGQAATVELVVIDGCGVWPTFVGGGPNAF
jgi:hypothetical protein